jgi:putative ABC transport system permease protein
MSTPRRVRAYRSLLRLFPRDFREMRGGELERLFSDMCAEWEEERGRLGLRFWVSLVWDTGREALGEWFSLTRYAIRSTMTRSLGEHMSTLIGDVRYAMRQLVRQPLYGVMVIVLMTLGIAGNAAVFRVFNGLFLRPLPFENSEQLVDLDETAPQWDLEFVSIAYPDFVAWRDNNRTFESMTVFTSGGLNFSSDGSAERLDYLAATHDVDDVLGLDPVIGRFFNAEEDIPDGPRVGLLSQGFWEQQFGRDPDVLGRTVSLSGRDYEIIGVLPPEARFVEDADIWVPLRGDPARGGSWSYNGIGRLRDGVTIDQARDDLRAIHKGMIDERPVNDVTSPVINALRDRYLGDYRLGSSFLLGAVGIVLLIACANIAGLMTARSMARGPEMAVRLAMGAPRLRIVRQLLTESFILASMGAISGTALGIWGSSLIVEPMADQFPRWVSFDLDMRFLAFTLLVTVGAAVLFGLVPALQGSANGHLVSGANRSTATTARRRGVNLLVTGEVALALVLLVVGGLSMLDVSRLGRVDPGFEADGLVSYDLTLPSVRYEDANAQLAFAEDYLSRLEAIPGTESAAIASGLPLSGHWGWFFQAEGAPPRGEDEANPVVLNRVVSPSYFETLGVRFVAGRPFDQFDGREEGNRAIIVNETFVRTHLSHVENPIGARVTTGTDAPGEDAKWMTVIGVTRDVKHYGVDKEMRPGVYQPLVQNPLARFRVALRTRGDASSIVSAARIATAEIDVELPIYNVDTMAEQLNESLWTRRATSWLIAVFSMVALLLAVAGIYGVISYSVSQRTQEISIRMAMGAQKQQVLNQVVRQGMLLVALGVVLGIGMSVAGAGLVSGILVGVSATDPTVYGAVTVLLVAVAALANYLPARRAAAVDPMKALRGE